MNKKLKAALIIAGIVILLVGIAILKNKLSDKSSVPPNDPYEAGNSSGNLYNGGYFAEKEGIVYFSNQYDGGKLYSMNSDQTNIKKLSDGSVSFINVLGDYIYYYSETSGSQGGLGYVRNGRGLYRTDIKGKETFSLTKTTTDGFLGLGDNLYFNSFNEAENSDNAIVTLETVTTSNQNQRTLLRDHVAIGGYYAGNLYYAGMDQDHCLYAINTMDGSVVSVSSEWFYLPIISQSSVFYLDLRDDYHLKSISLADGNVNTIVNERVDTYNIYNGIIYYQNVDPDGGYALKRVYTDGTGLETVADGVYCDINITPDYVYFRGFQNELPIYQQSTFGSVNVNTFDAALQAVMN